MAASIVQPTPQEWEIIDPFLMKCVDGALVIPPVMAQWLKEQGVVVSADSLTDYNFAGGADLCLDVMDRIDHRALYFLDANFATWYVDGLRDTLESPAWDEPARRSIR